MFRIRAVESPPDAKTGLKKVWHRGALHAELVSEIDTLGEVARHEFSLYDDVVVWERNKGFVTGQSVQEGSTRGAQNVTFDGMADRHRIDRIATALLPYAGRDRIIQHLRELVLSTQKGSTPMRSLGVVTGNNPVAPPPSAQAPTPPPQAPPAPVASSRLGLYVMALGALLVVIALAVLLLK